MARRLESRRDSRLGSLRYVSSLRFGVVEIVVHEGRVTQIERTERFRLDKRASAPDSAGVTTASSSE